MTPAERLALITIILFCLVLLATAWGGSWRVRAKDLERRLLDERSTNLAWRTKHDQDVKRAERLIKQLTHSIKYIKGEV